MRKVLVGLSAIGCVASVQAVAAPIESPVFGPSPFDSGVHVQSSIGGDDQGGRLDVQRAQVSDTDFTSVNGPQGFPVQTESRSDIASGETGVRATNGQDGFSSSANIRIFQFDVLRFAFEGTNAGPVDFSLTTTGTMFKNAGLAVASSGIRVADVTGLADPFLLLGVPTFPDSSVPYINAVDTLTTSTPFGDFIQPLPDYLVDARDGFALIDAADEQAVENGVFGIGGATDYAVNEDGTLFDVDYTVSGGFTAIEGRDYAIVIDTVAAASGIGAGEVDLLGTSTFEFGPSLFDNRGAVFSASGVFPDSQPFAAMPPDMTPIPLPAPILLLLAGLGALAGVRGMRRPAAG